MTIFGDPLLAELLSLANIFFGVTICVYNLRNIRYCKLGLRWLYYTAGFLGLYWAAIYLFVFFTKSNTFDAVLFGQIFIRPVLTFTLAVMASLSLVRWRASKKNE